LPAAIGYIIVAITTVANFNSTLSIDWDRIDRVFGNLISNAIKHTPINGSITLKYLLTANHKEVIITVQDSGTGIKEKNLPYIFDRFYKASQSRDSLKGSSGLGLAIAKEIIESHGGRIWSESPPEGGTAIHFTLPLQLPGCPAAVYHNTGTGDKI